MYTRLKRINELLEKHGYTTVTSGETHDAILTRWMNAMMDELEVLTGDNSDEMAQKND